MKEHKMLNSFSPHRWLYTTILDRTFTYSIWWRLASMLSIVGVFYFAFLLHPTILLVNLCIVLVLLLVKVYNLYLRKSLFKESESINELPLDAGYTSHRQTIAGTSSKTKRALVVGAGPCGLATAKTLIQSGYETHIIESSQDIGGKFARIDPDLLLTSSKHLISFSDFEIPVKKSFIKVREYQTYLKAYAEHFKVDEHLHLKAEVKTIEKNGNGKYEANYHLDGQPITEEFDVVSICTGLHSSRKSNLSFKNYTGDIKARVRSSCLKGKKSVLVIGNGESSWEMIKKCQNESSIENIYVSVSKGFFPFPNELKKEYFKFPSVIGDNNVADVQTPPLFVYLWIHPWLMKSRLFYFLVDGIALPLYFSLIQPFGVKNGFKLMPKWGFPSSIQHFIMKTEIGGELGILGNSDTKSTKIKYIEHPIEFEEQDYLNLYTNGDKKKVKIDLVCDGTGYTKPNFPFLSSKPNVNVRHIVNQDEPKIAFMGFVRPSIGAIPPLAEAQALWWVNMMDKELGQLSPEFYSMVPPKHRKNALHGVHFDAYLCQLGKDIGIIPEIDQLFKSPKNYIGFMFSHAGAHMLRLFGKHNSQVSKKIAINEFKYNSLYAATGWWFIFIFSTHDFGDHSTGLVFTDTLHYPTYSNPF